MVRGEPDETARFDRALARFTRARIAAAILFLPAAAAVGLGAPAPLVLGYGPVALLVFLVIVYRR